MYETGKRELAKAHSLMERMEKHLTAEQAQMLTEQKTKTILGEAQTPQRSDVIQIDNLGYNLKTPEDLLKALTKEEFSPLKGWFVTLGYIKAFTELGKKTVKTSIEKFDDTEKANARELNSKILNKALDNPQYVMKGKTKGNIINPFHPDSRTWYIVEAAFTKVMYAQNPKYGEEKKRVEDWAEQYQKDNPEKVEKYLQAKNYQDFVGQLYYSRSTKSEPIPGTNMFKKGDNAYEMKFKTPTGVIKKYKKAYFIINDEDNVEQISEAEAKAYINLYGSEPVHRVSTDDDVVKEVAKAIQDTKDREHQGAWTTYDLDKIFLMNFSTKESNGDVKLTYYNPDVIVKYVDENTTKTSPAPAKYTKPGAFSKHIEQLRQNESI